MRQNEEQVIKDGVAASKADKRAKAKSENILRKASATETEEKLEPILLDLLPEMMSKPSSGVNSFDDEKSFGEVNFFDNKKDFGDVTNFDDNSAEFNVAEDELPSTQHSIPQQATSEFEKEVFDMMLPFLLNALMSRKISSHNGKIEDKISSPSPFADESSATTTTSEVETSEYCMSEKDVDESSGSEVSYVTALEEAE